MQFTKESVMFTGEHQYRFLVEGDWKYNPNEVKN